MGPTPVLKNDKYLCKKNSTVKFQYYAVSAFDMVKINTDWRNKEKSIAGLQIKAKYKYIQPEVEFVEVFSVII